MFTANIKRTVQIWLIEGFIMLNFLKWMTEMVTYGVHEMTLVTGSRQPVGHRSALIVKARNKRSTVITIDSNWAAKLEGMTNVIFNIDQLRDRR